MEAAQRDAGHPVGQAMLTPGAPEAGGPAEVPEQMAPTSTGRKGFLEGQGCSRG